MTGLIFIKNLAQGCSIRLRLEVKKTGGAGRDLPSAANRRQQRQVLLRPRRAHESPGRVSLDAESGPGDLGRAKVTSPRRAGPEGLHL